MRFLAATLMVVAACGGPKTKHEGSIVEEGSATPANCCCKTIPDTAEKEIQPVYAMEGRMECSSKHGDCVDDVQCNGAQQPAQQPSGNDTGTQQTGTGVPPPPDLPAGN